MRTRKENILFAKDLRKNQTIAERILWDEFRNSKFKGYKFRRQHPIGNSYIVDFYCAKKKFIIEVDGTIHNDPEVKEKDKIREDFLKEWGYKIIRFTNDEIINNIEAVKIAILNSLVEG